MSESLERAVVTYLDTFGLQRPFCENFIDNTGTLFYYKLSLVTSCRLPWRTKIRIAMYNVFPWLISNLMHKILIYLHIIHLLKSSTFFRALLCSSSGGLRRNCIYAAFGDCLVHRLRTSFLTGAQDSHLQRLTIPEAAYIQLRRRPPEDEQGNM